MMKTKNTTRFNEFQEVYPDLVYTNYDKFTDMSEEEIAHFLSYALFHGYCEQQILKWLREPVSER